MLIGIFVFEISLYSAVHESLHQREKKNKMLPILLSMPREPLISLHKTVAIKHEQLPLIIFQ